MSIKAGVRCEKTLAYLLERRSVKVSDMREPGPSTDEVQTLLTAAVRVPDHGRMVPWRFVVFEGDARKAMGDVLRASYLASYPDAQEEKLDLEAGRFMRAPLVIAVISRIRQGKHPQWEQILSAGAVCQNMILAANALGYGAQWLTEWYAYDERVRAALTCDERDNIAGFVYMGTPPDEKPAERERPDLDALVTRFGEDVQTGDERYDREKFGFPRAGFRSV